MPDAKFLEEYQLYRKFEFRLPSYFHEIKDVNINMYCPNCEETRTFRFLHKYQHEKKLILRTAGGLGINRLEFFGEDTLHQEKLFLVVQVN